MGYTHGVVGLAGGASAGAEDCVGVDALTDPPCKCAGKCGERVLRCDQFYGVSAAGGPINAGITEIRGGDDITLMNGYGLCETQH